jgi:hypothetical protein
MVVDRRRRCPSRVGRLLIFLAALAIQTRISVRAV